MAKLNLIIADTDTMYLEGIKNYIGNNYSEKFTITCFTDTDMLMESLKSQKKKDILLINKELFNSDIKKLDIKAVLILSESKDVDREYPYPVINKYQTGPNMYKEIINAYSNQNPKKVEVIMNKYESTRLITVYSPIGGSGKSMISAGLSMALAQKGYEVLYLSYEDAQSTGVYFNGSKEKSFSELIYYVKDRSEEFSKKFLEIVDKDSSGVSFFANTDNILDIEDIDKDDMKWMLESLLALNMFKCIVIDTTSKYNSVYSMMINSSNHVVCPVLKEKTAITKLDRFLDSLTDIDKYFFLYNKSRSDIRIENPESLNDFGKEISMEIQTDFGMYLKEGPGILESQIIRNGINNIIHALGL